MLAGKGRGGDTMLAHITPREVSLLKEAGGAGTVNPDTGLLEFYDWSGGYGTTDPTSSYQSAPSYTPTAGDWTGYSPVNSAPSDYGMSPAAAMSIPSKNNYTETQALEDLETMRQQNVGMMDMPKAALDSTAMRGPADLYMAGQAPAAGTAAAQERQALIGRGAPAGEKEKPFLSNEQMVRLGLAGGLGVYGAMQQRKAAEQMKKATAEQSALAKPYQEEGRRLIEAAKGGELSPAAAQQYQAMKAQLAQGSEQRGGVGVAQAAAQAEAFKNQLLQGQYDAGLKVSGIGDQIALGAIRTGMQLDQQLTQANIGFYTQLGALAAGIPTYRSPT